MPERLAHQPGTYQLLLRLRRDAVLRVGRLGEIDFAAGWYVYTGSAMGGLGARVARHCRREKRLHWHVDYLLTAARIETIAARPSRRRLECWWHRRTARLPGACQPVRGFGASDCRCYSHLIWLPEEDSWRRENQRYLWP